MRMMLSSCLFAIAIAIAIAFPAAAAGAPQQAGPPAAYLDTAGKDAPH